MNNKKITYWEKLRDNPETWKAVDNLLDKGLCEEDVVDMLRQIAAFPELWESLNEESPENRTDRRKLMAKKIRQLAEEMEQDRDAKYFSVADKIPVSATRAKHNLVPLTDILKEAADNIVKRRTPDDSLAGFLEGKSTTRNYLEEFVRREVARILLTLLNDTTNKPNADAARLCNAILETNPVTADKMKDTFKNLSKGGD